MTVFLRFILYAFPWIFLKHLTKLKLMVLLNKLKSNEASELLQLLEKYLHKHHQGVVLNGQNQYGKWPNLECSKAQCWNSFTFDLYQWLIKWCKTNVQDLPQQCMYSVRIQFKCGKIWTRKTSNTDTFQIVQANLHCNGRSSLTLTYNHLSVSMKQIQI